MKYIKILLIALTVSFFGLTAISPVYAADSNPLYNETEEIGQNFCEEPSVKNVLKFIGYFLQLARLFVPIILIAQGTLTFFKAVTSDADSELKKSAYALARKVAIGILVFFVPAILDGIFGLFSLFSSVTTEYTSCKNCLLKPSECKTTGGSSGGGGSTSEYSENCYVLSTEDCIKYSNCNIVPPSPGSNNGPTCGHKAGTPSYAEDCSVKSYTECPSYYNCEIVPPSPGSNNGPGCGPKKNLQ